MGLSLVLLKPSQYDDLSMGYGRFNDLRRAICEVAGVTLVTYVKDSYHTISYLESDSPFWELRNHYDNDGQLSRTECEELLTDFEFWESEFKEKQPDYYEDYSNLMELIRECADSEGIIEFR